MRAAFIIATALVLPEPVTLTLFCLTAASASVRWCYAFIRLSR